MTAEPRPTLNRWLRLSLSLLVTLHLLAVVAPPLAFQARGPLGLSPSVNTLISWVQDYSQFLYMDRGYAFFAPDPGPSHLIQVAIASEPGTQEPGTQESGTQESGTQESGTQKSGTQEPGTQEPGAQEQMYPDRQAQWPRLLYHRHFMITEFLEEIYQPPGPPPALFQVDPVEAENWTRARARYEHVRQSVIDHLRHENPGREVAVRRIEHLVPNLSDYRNDRIELTDPRLYQVLLDEPIASDELSAPAAPPESIPPPSGQPLPASPGAASDDSPSDSPASETPDGDTQSESGAADPPSADQADGDEVDGAAEPGAAAGSSGRPDASAGDA
jgi:hypothetical protein